jgi:hypothetical protein
MAYGCAWNTLTSENFKQKIFRYPGNPSFHQINKAPSPHGQRSFAQHFAISFLFMHSSQQQIFDPPGSVSDRACPSWCLPQTIFPECRTLLQLLQNSDIHRDCIQVSFCLMIIRQRARGRTE